MTLHLGVAHSHNATVSAMRDGELVFIESEERLSRTKNHHGFPHRVLEHVFGTMRAPGERVSMTFFNDGFADDFDHDLRPNEPPQGRPYGSYLSKTNSFESQAMQRSESRDVTELRTHLVNFLSVRRSTSLDGRKQRIAQAFGINAGDIHFINHHLAHALSCIPFLTTPERTLVFVLDGIGDQLSALVGIVEEGGFRALSKSIFNNSLGMFYRFVTGLLGLKMDEHEYKVMGLAPYAKPQHYKHLYDGFQQLYFITDDGCIKSRHNSLAHIYQDVHSLVKFERFDNIAGAAQQFLEDIVRRWVAHWMERTGVRHIACAGGVFMNVKLNAAVAALAPVRTMAIVPSCGDESTAIGCSVYGHARGEGHRPVHPVRRLDLGREVGEAEIAAALADSTAVRGFEIERCADVNARVAELLAAGEVVARCSGRMEFGARALGNRSILADPSRPDAVMLINEVIKNRDFWMPFAPSILAEHADLYIDNPKGLASPFMMFAFPTTPLGQRTLAAAIHRYDFTARAQHVHAGTNPTYHDLIAKFAARTGIHALLNTSFNLHGEPIVATPADAIDTARRSGLRYLCLGNVILRKTAADPPGPPRP